MAKMTGDTFLDRHEATKQFVDAIDFLNHTGSQRATTLPWRPWAIATEVTHLFQFASQSALRPRDAKLARELTTLVQANDLASAFNALSDYTKQLLKSSMGSDYEDRPTLNLTGGTTLARLREILPESAQGARQWQVSNQDTRGGAVPDRRIQQIVGRLAEIFRRFTGRWPTHSEHADQATPAPFDRFVGEAFRHFWWEEIPPWGAINEATRRQIGHRSRSPRAYSPPKRKKPRSKALHAQPRQSKNS